MFLFLFIYFIYNIRTWSQKLFLVYLAHLFETFLNNMRTDLYGVQIYS